MLSNKENILKGGFWSLQKKFKQISTIDTEQLQNLKERLKKASKKERKILKSEIKFEEDKLKIEKIILDLEVRLNQYTDSFNKFLAHSVEHLGRPENLFEVKDNLAKARLLLKDISEMLKETKSLEEKLVNLTKAEKILLKKEKKTV